MYRNVILLVTSLTRRQAIGVYGEPFNLPRFNSCRCGGYYKLLWADLRPSEEKRLADILTDGWYRASTTPAIVFVRKPIGLLRRGFDVAFGETTFSKKAFFRAAFLGNILFIAARTGQ